MMRRVKSGVLVLIFFLLALFWWRSDIYAVEFGQVYLRLGRLQVSSAISAVLCAKPSAAGAGTEAKIQITFPSDFTISTTTSNWTTSTTNLPSGTTAWPAIGGSASTVSGQVVTFVGGDLTAASIYCFNLTGAGSTTSASTGAKVATISTLASDDSVINIRNIGLAIVSSDQLTVSATVVAQSTDFTADLTQTTSGSQFPQNSTIQYQITYGSLLSSTAAITVEAEWSRGTIEGQSLPSEDILDYVVGSASNAYGSATPVIDLTNRKISWTISSFPGNTTGQTVTFSLKTNASYTGSSLVDFTVSGRVVGPSTQTADSTVSGKYLFSAPTGTPTPTATQTPTPTPTTASSGVGPSATPGPGPSATPTPTAPSALTIDRVAVRTISDNSVGLLVTVSIPANVSVRYGLSPTTLTQKISGQTTAARQQIDITQLRPDTTYYFRITATADNQTTTSDIFTFTTARTSAPPRINSQTLVVTSQHILLYTAFLNPETALSTPSVVLPMDTPFEINFGLEKGVAAKQTQIILRRAGDPITDMSLTDMLEIEPSVFSGSLLSPSEGHYEVYARIRDYNGNLSEAKIADLKVVQPLQIYAEATQTPIEHARVFISRYNRQTKIYEIISPQILPIANPSFSRPDGVVPLVLPAGRYRAEVSALRYQSKTVDFTLGPNTGQDYPLVYLQPQPFSLMIFITYQVSTLLDALATTQLFAATLSHSRRFFELNAVLITAIFVLLTFISFSQRIRVPLRSLWDYFLHHAHLHIGAKIAAEKLRGRVFDEDTHKTLSNADVILIDTDRNAVVNHTNTNVAGEFQFIKIATRHYEVEVLKDGYKPVRFPEFMTELHIKKHETDPNLWQRIIAYLSKIIALGFETLLIVSLVFELLLGLTFGLLPAAVFIVLSFSNLLLWIVHLSRQTPLV